MMGSRILASMEEAAPVAVGLALRLVMLAVALPLTVELVVVELPEVELVPAGAVPFPVTMSLGRPVPLLLMALVVKVLVELSAPVGEVVAELVPLAPAAPVGAVVGVVALASVVLLEPAVAEALAVGDKVSVEEEDEEEDEV